jgi:membrane protein DedA with SNARE-associated domain
MQTLDYILSLIGQYGYLIVFFGVMLESIGVPLPGETILLASGFLVHQGALDLGDAIIFGILGAVIGDQIGYWVGRTGGRPFVLRWGRYSMKKVWARDLWHLAGRLLRKVLSHTIAFLLNHRAGNQPLQLSRLLN